MPGPNQPVPYAAALSTSVEKLPDGAGVSIHGMRRPMKSETPGRYAPRGDPDACGSTFSPNTVISVGVVDGGPLSVSF
jgi:hypothetical protein